MNLILGTVQLGLDYGIIKKKPTIEQSKDILNLAINSNILTFDTAQGYGNSEEILSNIELPCCLVLEEITTLLNPIHWLNA